MIRASTSTRLTALASLTLSLLGAQACGGADTEPTSTSGTTATVTGTTTGVGGGGVGGAITTGQGGRV